MTLQEKMERIKALQRQICGDLEYLRTLMDRQVLKYCEDTLGVDGLNEEASQIAYFREDLTELAQYIPQPFR